MGGLTFKRPLAELVIAGAKTQTRRRMNDNPRSPWWKGGCGFRVNQSYAVQPGRGKKAIGRVVVLGVAHDRLGAISAEDSRAEGFDTPKAFLEMFGAINGSADLDEPVWVLRFRPLGRTWKDHPKEADLVAANDGLGACSDEGSPTTVCDLGFSACDVDHVAIGRANATVAGETTCTGCGCTSSIACREGCSWASLDPPICTSCV